MIEGIVNRLLAKRIKPEEMPDDMEPHPCERCGNVTFGTATMCCDCEYVSNTSMYARKMCNGLHRGIWE